MSDSERLKLSTIPWLNNTDLSAESPFLLALHESAMWYNYLKLAAGLPVNQGDGSFAANTFPSLSDPSCRYVGSPFVTGLTSDFNCKADDAADIGVGARYAYSFDRSLVQIACKSKCVKVFSQTLLNAVDTCRSSWQKMMELGPSRWNGVSFAIFQTVLDAR